MTLQVYFLLCLLLMKNKCLPIFNNNPGEFEFNLKNCINPCLEKIRVGCVSNDLVFEKGIDTLLKSDLLYL